MVAAKIANVNQGANQYASKMVPPIGGTIPNNYAVTQKEAAGLMNVTERSLQRAVEAGAVTLSTAEEIARHHERGCRQRVRL